MIPALTNHLWQSTLFAVVAGLLTAATRGNRADVRYWLWFSASLKFLVPFSLLMSLGSHMHLASTAKKIAAPAVALTVVQIAEPFPDRVPLVSPTPAGVDWKPAALLALWACGLAAIALIRFRDWLRIQAAVRGSVPLDMPAAVEVRSSPGLLEPGVVGLFRPILLLPTGITERLTAAQLEAVLAHELCHISRRDNLLASIHILVEAMFWFHPVVWWIGAKLVEARERACDEAVLSLGSEPRVYAEGILNICKLYVESPLVCVSGVTGSDIKKRIEAIMTNRIVLRLDLRKKLLLSAAGVLAAAGPLFVGLMKAQSEAPLAFEVASVRQHPMPFGFTRIRRDCPSKQCVISGARFTEDVASLADLIMNAYNLKPSVKPYQISGLPTWGDSGRDVYDIAAKVEGDKTPAVSEVRRMLQTLLADRFRLKLHREQRILPVYALVAGKNGSGSKLSPATQPCELGLPTTTRQGKSADVPGNQARNPSLFSWQSVPDLLSMFADRSVIDKTGFDAAYYCSPDGKDKLADLFMQLAAGTTRGGGPVDRTTADADSGVSIFTLVEDKLGLKLEPQKVPLDILVIDHVERPSEN